MAVEYFVGLRASDDVADDERPFSWRRGIRELYPNGTVPLTALTSMMSEEKITSTNHHWWEETLIDQRATVSGVYDDAQDTAYTECG